MKVNISLREFDIKNMKTKEDGVVVVPKDAPSFFIPYEVLISIRMDVVIGDMKHGDTD